MKNVLFENKDALLTKVKYSSAYWLISSKE